MKYEEDDKLENESNSFSNKDTITNYNTLNPQKENNTTVKYYFSRNKSHQTKKIEKAIHIILLSIFLISFSFYKIISRIYLNYKNFKFITNPDLDPLTYNDYEKIEKKVVVLDQPKNCLYCLLIDLLETKYKIVYTDNNPDYVIYSINGQNHTDPKYNNAIKIFLTSINLIPDFNDCDYAFGSAFLNYQDRYVRLPYYLRKKNINILNKERKYIPNKKFCAWVVSNRRFKFRNHFFEKLSEYKKVDSGGKFKNNIGYRVESKKEFFKNYKFSITIENSASPGYSTEKIFDGFEAETIPIYYGDETIVDILNPKSFVLIKNESEEEVNNAINLIKKIDNDEEMYKEMLKEPIYLKDFLEYRFVKEEQKIKNYLFYIFDQDLKKARRMYNIK